MSILDGEMLLLAGVRLELDATGKPLNYVFLSEEERREEAKQRRKERENEKKKQRRAQRLEKGSKKDQPQQQVRIRWGNVDSFYFADTIGYGVVPSKGFYPLGMGVEEEAHRTSLTVDQAEVQHREMLIHRAIICGLCTDPSRSSEVSPDSSRHGSFDSSFDINRLETRQYDYKKRGQTNPLFIPLSEEERLLRLLPHTDDIKDHVTPAEGPAIITPTPPGSPSSARKGKRRAGSLDKPKEGNSSAKEVRLRSSSMQFDETLGLDTDMSVATLNKELRAIRSSRADGGGCSCRPLKVDKLSIVKLKQELEAFGTPEDQISSLGKTGLMGALKEKLKDCALCRENNCICVRDGIECRSDICECLRHGQRGGHKTCANPHGANIFDSAAVQEYRRQTLEAVGV